MSDVSIMPIPDTPNLENMPKLIADPIPVKVATPDLILFNNEAMPVELMTDLIFENIGGQEIINISRNDMLNGADVLYQPIKNITSLRYQYNPQNILNLQDSAGTYFKNFSIKLEDKVPNEGNGIDGSPVYIDPDTGNLVIDLVNLNPDEQVEVQILSSGSILDGTIYTG
jgi:hypothetical protein